MSGGIAKLVAVGDSNAHLVGQPEVSFFRSNYKRHTNFAQTVERQVIQGNPSTGGMSTGRFERKGDMVGYVYISNRGANISSWSGQVAKVELLIGGQVIDEQEFDFSATLAPTVMNQTYAKSTAAFSEKFYPLRFSFCENAQSAIPLIALQYHDVELRITWGSSNSLKDDFEVYAQFIHLDTDERTALSSTPQNMLITQTQKAIASGSKMQELNFNHPIKCLVAADGSALSSAADANKMKLQINGTDVTDFKYVDPNYTAVTSYYHTTSSKDAGAAGENDKFFLYPFCLDTSKVQPTGSLNFSRVDSARLVSDNTSFANTIYAVNYNILRIENGMGGLMYSN